VTATATVTPAVTANYSVGINIYNSAGEVVKTFPAQGFSVPVDQVTLDSSVIATLSGPGSSVTIYFNGALLGIWDGTNQSGHAVSNGDYRIQISNVGNSGVVTTVSQKVVVNRKVSVVETDIFNSAGEAVRHLYNVADNATNENMTNVSLSTDIMKASALTIPNNSLPSQIKIQIQTSSTQINLIWDGSGDKGNYVTPGQYLIQVRWTDGNGNTTLIDHVVTVLPGIVVTGTVVAKPNFLSASNGLTTSFDASGVSGAAALKVNIYDIAGELVQKLLSPSPQVNWTASGVASGIYIAHVTVQNTNNVVIAQQSLKILVTH
jgi:flagellar hook assembly protein FlgD